MNCKVRRLGKGFLFAEFEGCSWARKRSVTFLISHTFVYIFLCKLTRFTGKIIERCMGNQRRN